MYNLEFVFLKDIFVQSPNPGKITCLQKCPVPSDFWSGTQISPL